MRCQEVDVIVPGRDRHVLYFDRYLDEISNEAFKTGYEELKRPLVHLFNNIYNNGVYTDTWCDGFIIPIHKKNDVLNVNNYRGIIIPSCIDKLFLRVVAKRIEEFISASGKWCANQCGLGGDHRTEDSLFIINTLFDSYIKQQDKALYVAFVGFFSKLFDKINRTYLLYKLLKYGITGKTYDIIKSMYANTGYRVRVSDHDHLSPRFIASLGVKQGCCLSPMLSNIFQNDLHDIFKTCNCDPVVLGDMNPNSLSLADDLMLISTTRKCLQECLNKLYTHCLKRG